MGGRGGRSLFRSQFRSPSNVNEGKLVRFLEQLHNPTLDEAVDHVLVKCPEYRRQKQTPFRSLVQNLLQANRTPVKPINSNSDSDDDDDEDDVPTRARKRAKKSAIEEQRTSRSERGHRVRILVSGADEESEAGPGGSREEGGAVSTPEDEEPEGGSGESWEKDGNVSASDDEESEACSGESGEKDGASEDGIFSQPVQTKFDVTSSSLRDNYRRKPKAAAATIIEEEIEVPRKLINAGSIPIEAGGGSEAKKMRDGGKSYNANASGLGDGFNKGDDGPRFRDLGGMDVILEELKMEVIVPLCHPQLPRWLGVRPMAGILLHGPPGCGKTKLAHAIANETGVPFYKISATEVVSGVSGASEENIRDLFAKAYRTAPSIVFIDEIDAIASKREKLQREMERRIVTQLMTCMDELHAPADGDSKTGSSDCRPGYVLVIGATNRPDAVDPALRRPGRFDREFALGIPDEAARVKILSVLTRNLRVEGSFDLLKLGRCTPGFVGADLSALANKAGNLAMKRIIDRKKAELLEEPAISYDQTEGWWKQPWSPEEVQTLNITMADFMEAAKIVQPSLRREGFSTIPDVKWEDVGGLDTLRHDFDRYIVERIKFPEIYEEFGVDLETGFLLYGPPGCGKTLIAKAVANEAGANFIHVQGPELLNKYVGESELAVRTIFSRARACAPCILFFDEVDALTTKRGREGGWVVERLLTQLLTELTEKRPGVFVIGATNRPEVMDDAALRPGRFGKRLYVPLPSPDQRGLILTALARKKRIDEDADLIAIGKNEACDNLSGADLAVLLNEAAMAALEEKKLSLTENNAHDTPTWTIRNAHFDKALKKIKPSVSYKQKQYYQTLSERFTPE